MATSTTNDDYTIHLMSSDGEATQNPSNTSAIATDRKTLRIWVCTRWQWYRWVPVQVSTSQENEPMCQIRTSGGCKYIVGVLGFRAIWQMMIQYPLKATFSMWKQCHKIQATYYLPTFLSKMGINHTSTSTTIQHGPPHLGGMNRVSSTANSLWHIFEKMMKLAKWWTFPSITYNYKLESHGQYSANTATCSNTILTLATCPIPGNSLTTSAVTFISNKTNGFIPTQWRPIYCGGPCNPIWYPPHWTGPCTMLLTLPRSHDPC